MRFRIFVGAILATVLSTASSAGGGRQLSSVAQDYRWNRVTEAIGQSVYCGKPTLIPSADRARAERWGISHVTGRGRHQDKQLRYAIAAGAKLRSLQLGSGHGDVLQKTCAQIMGDGGEGLINRFRRELRTLESLPNAVSKN